MRFTAKSSVSKLPQLENGKSGAASSKSSSLAKSNTGGLGTRASSALSNATNASTNSTEKANAGASGLKASEHIDSSKKLSPLHGQLKELGYNYLQDPGLSSYLSQAQVQSLLERNGWLAENAPCCLCGAKDAGAIKVCQRCHRFYHIYCLPPLPLSNSNLRVLLLHSSKKVSDVKLKIFKTGYFRRVDDVNYNKYFVRLEMLALYDAVVVFNGNNVWLNADGLGDMLANFVDNGGGVVLMCLSSAEALGGKWRRLKYSPIFPGRDRTGFQLSIGQVSKPHHPLMENVNSFNGGNMSFHVSGAVNERASIICRWSNGQPLIAVLDNHPTVPRGRVVYLNFYPFSSSTSAQLSDDGECQEVDGEEASDPDYWDTNTDGCVLMSNAIRFASNPPYPKEDMALVCFQCTSNGAKPPATACPTAAARSLPLGSQLGNGRTKKSQLKAIYLNDTLIKKPGSRAHARSLTVGIPTTLKSDAHVDLDLCNAAQKERILSVKHSQPVRKYLRAATESQNTVPHTRSASAPESATLRSDTPSILGAKLPPLSVSNTATHSKKEFSLATETILLPEDLGTGSSGCIYADAFAGDSPSHNGDFEPLQRLEERAVDDINGLIIAQRALLLSSPPRPDGGDNLNDQDSGPLWKDKPAQWERRLDAISSDEVLNELPESTAREQKFVPVYSGTSTSARRASVSSTGSTASFLKSKKRVLVTSNASSHSIVVGANANLNEPVGSSNTVCSRANSAGTSGRAIAAVSGSTMTSEERQDARLSRPGSSSNPIQLTAVHIGLVEALIAAMQDCDVTALTNIVCKVSPKSEWRVLNVGYEARTFTNFGSAIASTFPSHFGILLRHLVTPATELECPAIFNALKSKSFESVRDIVFSNNADGMLALRQAYAKSYGLKLGQLIQDVFPSERGTVLKVLLEGYLISSVADNEQAEEVPINYKFEYLDRLLRLASEREDPVSLLAQHYKRDTAEMLADYVKIFKDPLAFQVGQLEKFLELPDMVGRALAHIGDSIVHVATIYQQLFAKSLLDQCSVRLPDNDYQNLLKALLLASSKK